MSRVSQSLDRVRVTFDDDNLVANAGLLLPATLIEQLGVEALINTTVRLDGRVGGESPGRKVDALRRGLSDAVEGPAVAVREQQRRSSQTDQCRRQDGDHDHCRIRDRAPKSITKMHGTLSRRHPLC